MTVIAVTTPTTRFIARSCTIQEKKKVCYNSYHDLAQNCWKEGNCVHKSTLTPWTTSITKQTNKQTKETSQTNKQTKTKQTRNQPQVRNYTIFFLIHVEIHFLKPSWTSSKLGHISVTWF